MLFKNGQPFELTTEQKNDVKSKFDRFPVVLQFHKNKRKWDNVNKMWKQPPLLAIETTATAEVKGELVTIKYASNTRTDRKGNMITTPTMLESSGKMMIDKTQLDLLWFLYYCADHVSNNDKKSSDPFFEFEFKAIEAQKKIQDKTSSFTALKYILDPVSALSDEKLIELCKSYKIYSEDMQLQEVKDKLVVIAESESRRDDFISRCKELEDMEDGDELVETIVRRALDENVVRRKAKNSWAFHWVDENGELGPEFTKVRSSSDVESSLVDRVKGSEVLLNNLKKQMQHKGI